MKKIFYLSTCTSCKKIMDELDLTNFELQDIKSNPLSAEQLGELYKLAGSYEALFSKRAQLYKKLNLKDKNLGESDFKKYLLTHYTFLKRPVLVDESHIYIGSSPSTKKDLIAKYGS